MKKIIIGILSLGLLFLLANNIFASSIWNTASNDCPSIAVANFSTNTGYVDPCWPLLSVDAKADDSVNVRIYYHNTGTQTATNTRIVLDAPTMNTSTSTHSFTGKIISDQGNISFGPVYVKLDSSQKLSFGSTRWYPNQSTSYQEFQAEVINGGLNIGSIAPGWSSQGSVVVSFRVNKPITDCKITSFTSDKTDVASNEAVVLYWTTSNCKYVNISNVGNGLPVNGNRVVHPNTDTTYTITGFGDTSVIPTQSLTIKAGSPVFVPGFPAGVPGFDAYSS